MTHTVGDAPLGQPRLAALKGYVTTSLLACHRAAAGTQVSVVYLGVEGEKSG